MSKYRGAWEVGTITESNISGSDQKKKLLLYLLPVFVKNSQRETKLFECSWDPNREELKIRKNNVTF